MINIGVAQIKNSTDICENFKMIKQCLDIFQSSDVDLVLFPECSLSGFSAAIGQCNYASIKKYLSAVKNWSEEYDVTVVLPTALKEEKIYNTGFVFQSGQMDRFYKLGLTESEKKFFSIPEGYTKKVYNLKGYNFIPLICLEAQLHSEQYFSEGEVDFILWPGYWGWEKQDKWEAQNADGKENLVFSNSSKWSVPLIQSNFSYNDIGSDKRRGPRGLSVVVNKENQLAYRASFEEQECFVVKMDKQAIHECYRLGNL